MEEYYEMYEFTYKAKGDLGLCIIARTEEIANKILYWVNIDRDEKEKYKPRLFRFKKKILIDIEPYSLEQHQLETAELTYKNRCEYRRNNQMI